MIKWYLNFVTSQHGRLEINEPEGADKVPFVIAQHGNGYGRDISRAGGDASFRVYSSGQNEYHFDKILYNWQVYRSNAVIKLEAQFDAYIFILGDVDMGETFKRIGNNIIEFNVYEESFIALYKKRYEVSVNLFDTLTVDKLPIEPVQTYDIFLPPVPTPKVSEWDAKDGPFNYTFLGYGQDTAIFTPFVNNAGLRHDIENSHVPFTFSTLPGAPPGYQELPPFFSESQLQQAIDYINLVDAKSDLSDLTVQIDNFSLSVNTTGFNVRTQVMLNYGTSFQTGQYTRISLFDSSDKNVHIENESYTVTIPNVPNTGKIWFHVTVFQPYSLPAATPVSSSTIFYNGGKLTISATSRTFPSVAKAIRLIDAMKYVSRSVTGNAVNAPRWDAGGEFYNQFIINSNLMRQIQDKPFNITNKFIAEEYLPEVNGDYEVEKSGNLFYGIYRDFYANTESWVFQGNGTEYQEYMNKRFGFNLFRFAYKAFQSQKETERENTADIVHGNLENYHPNINGQNTKEVNIGIIRDSYLIDDTRQKSWRISKTAATQDDNKIFAIDAIVQQQELETDVTMLLEHRIRGGYLNLTSLPEDPQWNILGVYPGAYFTIPGDDDINAGVYKVSAVQGNVLILENYNNYSLIEIDEISTRFIYEVNVDIKARTNEGFDAIENFNNKEGLYNLAFTLKRNIRNFYNEMDATNTLYVPGDKSITNRVYNNNPEAITVYNGDYQQEGAPYVATGALVDDVIIEITVNCSLKDWYNMMEKLRSERGYIRVMYDGLPIKGYLTAESNWTRNSRGKSNMSDYFGTGSLVLEKKYEPAVMVIAGETDNFTINDEIMAFGATFHIDAIGNLHIFDATGWLLFTPVLFNAVSVNGQVAESKLELGEWMEQLMPEWDGI